MQFFRNPTIQPVGMRIQTEKHIFEDIELSISRRDLIFFSLDAAFKDGHFKKNAVQKNRS